MRRMLVLILISAVAIVGCSSRTEQQASDMPVLKGPYLGMKPPGDVPELFAPGVVSSVYLEHSSAVFTPDGNEVFWSREINIGFTPRIIVVMHMRQERGVWTRPELAPFNFNDALYNHINSISPDGKRLYYFSSSEEDSKSWVVDKTDDGWGEPRLNRLNTIDNPGKTASSVHEARSGNLYLTGTLDAMPLGWGIVRSRFVDGKYQAYESLGPHVNLPFDDPFPNYHPTVDPDERFVIFTSRRPGGYGTQDLYISYRQPDESFGPAINLGPKINTIGMGNGWPQLSPDGKYLFFWSNSQSFDEKDLLEQKYSYADLMEIRETYRNGRGNIFWVNTSFVEELRPAGDG